MTIEPPLKFNSKTGIARSRSGRRLKTWFGHEHGCPTLLKLDATLCKSHRKQRVDNHRQIV